MKDFYAHLTALRQMARSAPAEQLLEEIFASTGYLAALGVLKNGARRREDARRFASFCAGAGSGGISALVRAIDAAALAGSTGQDTVPGGSRPGCVAVMTIHRSKGLQFPVVFVADTARRFNAADTRQPVEPAVNSIRIKVWQYTDNAEKKTLFAEADLTAPAWTWSESGDKLPLTGCAGQCVPLPGGGRRPPATGTCTLTTMESRPAISRCRTTFNTGYELPSTGGMGTAPFGVPRARTDRCSSPAAGPQTEQNRRSEQP